MELCYVLLLLTFTAAASSFDWERLRLPLEHIPYYFNNNPQLKDICAEDSTCPYKNSLLEDKCWGYEKNCPDTRRMLNPTCPEDVSWMPVKSEQIDKFWLESDFGYIKHQRDSLTTYCSPENELDSYLMCNDHTRYCVAKFLFMDLKSYDFTKERNRYSESVFQPGGLGGHCKFNKAAFEKQGDHKSPLQSWYGEMQHYTQLNFHPMTSKKCDITFEKPTILMKLDAGVNMYHHFCDYINLYASQHIYNNFSMDFQIIMWDTSMMNYGDFFSDTWKAFSHHPVIHLNEYRGKTLCFREAVFPLLARMRYGLYYNMPLVPGCQTSSLYRALNQHILHRLNITQRGPIGSKVRVTVLERKTKFRNIMNQDELVTALQAVPGYEVQVVDYRQIKFLEQLQVTYNSDIFIGMHGAGLTHLLFQPDWGVAFELYNCEDKNCYKDLARQRGLLYLTWENQSLLDQEDEGHHPTLGAHAKFTNYGFDVAEFLRLVAKGAQHVRDHKTYQTALIKKRIGSKKFGRHIEL